MKTSAGILLKHNDQVLLAHSTNAPWNTWMPPKGNVEEGEIVEDAAIRETEEEIGIRVDKDLLKREKSFTVDYDNSKGQIYKRAIIFVVDIDTTDLSKSKVVKQIGTLQFDEVDRIEWMRSSQIETKVQRRYVKPIQKII
jgi:8-oxo-dGTP pyrophosphatase MutT (NUDIX family)